MLLDNLVVRLFIVRDRLELQRKDVVTTFCNKGAVVEIPVLDYRVKLIL